MKFILAILFGLIMGCCALNLLGDYINTTQGMFIFVLSVILSITGTIEILSHQEKK